MTVRLRLIIIFVVTIALLIGLGTYAASIYRQNLDNKEIIWHYTRDELISGHQAQVAFERQKLAWENLILRGHEANRYHQYLKLFYKRERETRRAIDTLLSTLNPESEPAHAAQQFLNDHLTLGKRYREALKIYNGVDEPTFTTDRYIWEAMENPSSLLDEVIEKVVIHHSQELELLDKKIKAEMLRLLIFTATILLLIVAALIWFIEIKIGHPLNAITQAARSLRDGNLNQRVPAQANDEFGVMAEALNTMLDRLAEANKSLAARTVELEKTNKELESFSYTIAHDLRSPLRAITGFSQILQEDLKGNMDVEHYDLLNRISAAGLRMSEQIDHILKLNRLSLNKVNPKKVDLSELANEIVQEFKDSDPQRDVQIDIQPGLVTTGDAVLLRVVLQNLIGNAWKYTQKESHPVICFNSRSENGHTVYQVSDNGVGFDMQYADKLFGVFQRLHRDDEFEGVGVGLASVLRAIQRQGGWVKANSELGKGAEFIFSLNQE